MSGNSRGSRGGAQEGTEADKGLRSSRRTARACWS